MRAVETAIVGDLKSGKPALVKNGLSNVLHYFDGLFRAVDIERGFFQLVQTGNIRAAAEILQHA
jgi:hypothetical protein